MKKRIVISLFRLLWFGLTLVFCCLCYTDAEAMAAVTEFYVATNGSNTYFYVAPDGDDGNSGTLEKPFKTLDRSREAVRTIKWKQMSGQVRDIVVMLRGGRYYHTKPVLFTENDSSNYGCKITYRNYPGEKPVLIGGMPVSGWKKYKGKIYRANIPYFKEG